MENRVKNITNKGTNHSICLWIHENNEIIDPIVRLIDESIVVLPNTLPFIKKFK